MIIFAKYGEYDRRELLEECLTKYLETMKKPSSKANLPSLKITTTNLISRIIPT